jgi:hypothetical protein
MIVTADGTACEYANTAPSNLNDAQVQARINSFEDNYQLDCLKDLYRGYDLTGFEDGIKTDLEAFEEWIAAGHTNPGNVLIDKQPWISHFPPEAEPDYLESLGQLSQLSELADKEFSEVDAYIDTNITSLPEARTFLKKLTKINLAMLKILRRRGLI